MKLAAPGTRRLPAHSQWASAVQVLGEGLEEGPGRGCQGRGEVGRGLAGEVPTACRGWDRAREGTLSNLFENTVASELG